MTKFPQNPNGNSIILLIRLRKPSVMKIEISYAELQIAVYAAMPRPVKNVISFFASCAKDVVVQVREGLIGIADETALDVHAGPPDIFAGRPSVDALDVARSMKSDRAKNQIMQCLRTFHSTGAANKSTPGIFHLTSHGGLCLTVPQTRS